MRLDYSVVNGEMVVTDRETGSEVWKGKPEGWPVEDVLPVPGSEDAIVLVPYEAGPMDRAFQNLLRCRPDGSVVWRAELPDRGADTYVSVDWRHGALVANSWSCFLTELDPETGKIRSATFTK